MANKRGNQELTIGIDEAGRGPILGPMVLALVALTDDASRELEELGVTDSKLFGAGEKAHDKRLRLAQKVQEKASHTGISVVDVAEIDKRTLRGQLNQLEQERAILLLSQAPEAKEIVADGERLFAPLRNVYPKLRAENHGESAHVAVAAASILAKVRRDEMWQRIQRRYTPIFGDLCAHGGGYVNEATRRFLRAYCEKFRALPPEGRRSWPWHFVRDVLDPSQLPGPIGLPSQVEGTQMNLALTGTGS